MLTGAMCVTFAAGQFAASGAASASTSAESSDGASLNFENATGKVNLSGVALSNLNDKVFATEGTTVSNAAQTIIVELDATPVADGGDIGVITAQKNSFLKQLTAKGIKTNVTLVFSAAQALLAARAGATFVSPFLGRLDDIGMEGMSLIEEIVDIFNAQAIETEIIAASIRNPMHVTQAARLGCDIATVPMNVLLQMLKHPLTDNGIERFLKDWEGFTSKQK